MSANVVSLPLAAHNSRLSIAEYQRRRAELRERYGDSKADAGMRYEQELALLFARSGWTVKEIANSEEKTPGYIYKLIFFGKFLNSLGERIPENITFNRFMLLWAKTDKGYTDEARFKSVAEMLAADPPRERAPNKPIAEPIQRDFADGRWRGVESIAEKIGADPERVESYLRRQLCAHGIKVETKKVGGKLHCRIFEVTNPISSEELKTKLSPIVEVLKAEGKKSVVTCSPATAAEMAVRLQHLIDEWTK